mmetsp:Transcript_108304/g.312026  ORF Transcript_108304/g.312026 Transcript_108304/m.312026 type:complete len:235 (-) Transcript_108304:504-1208(-)
MKYPMQTPPVMRLFQTKRKSAYQNAASPRSRSAHDSIAVRTTELNGNVSAVNGGTKVRKCCLRCTMAARVCKKQILDMMKNTMPAWGASLSMGMGRPTMCHVTHINATGAARMATVGSGAAWPGSKEMRRATEGSKKKVMLVAMAHIAVLSSGDQPMWAPPMAYTAVPAIGGNQNGSGRKPPTHTSLKNWTLRQTCATKATVITQCATIGSQRVNNWTLTRHQDMGAVAKEPSG